MGFSVSAMASYRRAYARRPAKTAALSGAYRFPVSFMVDPYAILNKPATTMLQSIKYRNKIS